MTSDETTPGLPSDAVHDGDAVEHKYAADNGVKMMVVPTMMVHTMIVLFMMLIHMVIPMMITLVIWVMWGVNEERDYDDDNTDAGGDDAHEHAGDDDDDDADDGVFLGDGGDEAQENACCFSFHPGKGESITKS